jgi:hypothetical protein
VPTTTSDRWSSGGQGRLLTRGRARGSAWASRSTERPAHHRALARRVSVRWRLRLKFSSSKTSPSSARWWQSI